MKISNEIEIESTFILYKYNSRHSLQVSLTDRTNKILLSTVPFKPACPIKYDDSSSGRDRTEVQFT